ncbi:hypothetical protein QEZ40_001687 [Streptomyces katrae]|uniref:Uncharacterized protein n=1 Tax=Streptomyces katrae TaxID=68223 RepID=A0ABT7GUW9_9ACTN|nr:hypothetical protein [Streptomyces katrae]MDK9497039.1 hypothetical protein [Streptomyces katrae]
MSQERNTERDVIRAAMDRLLAGTPLRSDGALTILSLAAEAEVKRHVLTHRHTDLKDEFYARVRAQGHVPASERKLRDELEETKERLAEVLAENTRLQSEVDMFARVVNVLETENRQLRDRSEGTKARVVTLPGRRPPAT